MKYMKGLMMIALFAIMSTAVHAQENIVKLYPAGFHLSTGGGTTNTAYLFKAGYERVFSDKLSGQINLGFQTNRYKYDLGYFGGSYTVSWTSFVIEPQVKYYLLDTAPHGLYVGGYFIAAVRSGSAIMGLGPNVGYQYFFLDDRLALDASLGIGVAILTGGGSTNAGFDMPFQVGAGWAF